MHKQVQGYILGEFLLDVHNALLDNPEYSLQSHEVYKLGTRYIADLRIVEEVEPEVEETEEESVDVEEETVETEEEVTVETEEEVTEDGDTEITDTTIPDWELLDKLVADGDKEAIEEYGLKFGVDLNKRRSAANMLLDFKEFVGA